VLNVLIVDDDEITRIHSNELLKPHGHCRVAASGAQALALVEQSITDGQPYDLILMDVVMPVLDGLATVRRIVTLYNDRHVPLERRPKIVMLSSVDEPDTQIDALYACGADHYLLKPLDWDKLEAALAELKLIKSTA